MRVRVLACVAVISLSTPAARAETVTLTTRLAGENQTNAIAETVSLLLTPEPGAGFEQMKVDVPVPGTAQAELSPNVKWTAQLESDRLWTRALTISPRETNAYTLEIVPAGVLKGRLRDERGDLPRAELIVGFAPEGRQFPVAPDTSRCSTDASSRFSCTVPLGRYDLRFKTPQRTPVYRWAHQVARTSELGEIRVGLGGTIAGYIASTDLPKDPKDLRITVKPSTAVHQQTHKPVADSGKVHTGPQGFFFTSALPPGIYDLVVEVPNRGVAALAAIQVRDGLEARLPRSLVLEPRVPLTVRIAPPRPAIGSSWQLELMRSGAEGMQPAARGNASTEGTFVAENMVSGQYFVIVLDERGSRWAVQPLSVSPAASEFVVEIPMIYAEGTLRRGSELLKGSLSFGGQDGAPSIRFDADDQGSFRGMLPRTGEWTVDVVVPPDEDALAVSAVVTLDEETNVARADVTIPETLVEGIVVDTAGAPIPRADVTFARGPQRLGVAMTNAQGQFALRGLTPGPADVVASASGARSTTVNVRIDEGTNTPLRLIAHRLPVLKSQVVGPMGPVPGARIAIWPESGGEVSMTVTDSEGYFTAMGHPPTQRLAIAVHSPGLALFLGTLPAEAQQPPKITLSSGTGVLEIAADARVAYVEYGPTLIPVPLAFRLLAPAASMEREWRAVRLGDLPPGQYRACSQEAGTAPICASGWLAPGATLQLKIAPQ